MNDWIDKMMTPLSEGSEPVSEGRFEALEKAYMHHVRVRTLRRILVGTAAAVLLLLPVLAPVFRRGDRPGQGPGAPALLADAPAPAAETSAPATGNPVRTDGSPSPAGIDPAPERQALAKAEPTPAQVSSPQTPPAPSRATPGTPSPSPAQAVPSPAKAAPAPQPSTPSGKVTVPVEGKGSSSLPALLEDPTLWADPQPSPRAHRSRLSIGLLSSTNVSKREQSGAGFPQLAGTSGNARYCHYAPVSLGVRLDWWRGRRWRLTSGVEMTWYSSEYTRESGSSSETFEQNVVYMGMPLRIDRVWQITPGKSAFYVGLGGLVEKGLYGSNGSRRLAPDGWGLSAVGAVGMQYNLSSGLGFYFEPSLVRTLVSPAGRAPGSFATYRSENPLQFALYAGLRFLL